jgi:tRNA threonylcarbamoyladenosine biosynthesis protein TsaE
MLVSESPGETFRLGKILGKKAVAGDVYCLSGNLGTGKTVFARGVAAGLGVKGRVASPTFTLINEYQGRLPFYHIDVYRLGGSGEMADLGYEEYLYGQGVILIEWAERVPEVLPEERLDLELARTGDNSRQFRFVPRGARYQRLVEEIRADVRTGD